MSKTIKTLQSAIPKVWQTEIYETLSRALTNDVVSLQNTNFIVRSEQKDVSIINTSTKIVYQIIILRQYVQPTALDRWASDFNIAEDDWKNIFYQPYTCTRETTLQTLQYKIVHRIFPCRKWLHNLHVVDSPSCAKCNNLDNLIH